MDPLIAIGAVVLFVIGGVARFKPDMLWQIYSIEPRWKREHPEQPDDWAQKAQRQSVFFFASGIVFFLLSFLVV